ncbi:spermatogenic leucine zipper protein 1 [Perognathus longimembris pacificus]|uniref:spermatogenic leucine zipper protein 1 n=1 Tax=Perognathus longimembris pacificus TaxID=214514 RepID=UPI002019DDEA|nr:spermatogenic leucine zipper protein 1 [Perognathus longimembris pacificus]
MASLPSSAERSATSPNLNTAPGLRRGALDSGITIALLEIGSRPPYCWGSRPSPNNCSQPVTGPQTAQKVDALLRDIKDVLKSMSEAEEKTTETNDLFEDTNITKDVSELIKKFRGLDKTNKRLLKDLLFRLDPVKENNSRKLEMILKSQQSEDMVEMSSRDLLNRLEERSTHNKTQLSMDEEKYRSLYVHEENRKLRNNMEQLLEEADHWSKQQMELNEMIKLYQKSQKDKREILQNDEADFQSQPNNEASSKNELEEQVRKLNHDTYSLHLVAALLENECQILQQRVDILKEFHLHEGGTPQETLVLINNDQDKKNRKPSEAEKVETNKHNTRQTEGTVHKKSKGLKHPDACLSKKARNNRFNIRLSKALMGKKRPANLLS